MSNHTISSALRRCKQLAGELATNTARMQESVVYVEGDEPAYKFAELFKEHGELVKEMTDLRSKIAVANATTKLHDGRYLVEAIQRLTQIKSEISMLRTLPSLTKEKTEETHWEVDYDAGPTVRGDYPRRKIVTVRVCELPTRDRDTMVKALELEFSDLNAQVEHLNHTVKL